MAHSIVKPSVIPSLLLALFLSFGVSPYSARTVEVADVCSKHTNPSNCVYILYSIPGSAGGVVLDSLPQYIIANLGQTNAFDVITLINSLVRNTTDPQLKQRYQSCTMNYTDALGCFAQAKESCLSGDYNSMKSNIATVIKDVQDCDSKPPYDPSALPQLNKYLKDVSMIIMILADFLAGKY